MSYFGFYEKDNVDDAIRSLAFYEQEKGKSTREVIESILEVFTYSLDKVLYTLVDEFSIKQLDQTARIKELEDALAEQKEMCFASWRDASYLRSRATALEDGIRKALDD